MARHQTAWSFSSSSVRWGTNTSPTKLCKDRVEPLVKVYGGTSSPKKGFSSVRAGPELGLSSGALASWTGPLTFKTLIQSMGCLRFFGSTCWHLSPALLPWPRGPRSQSGAPAGTFTLPVYHLLLPVCLLGPGCLEQDLLSEEKYYCFFGHLFDPPESIFGEISTVM